MNNCLFVGNTARIGGAVSAGNASINLWKNKFVNNSAILVEGESSGGAIFLEHSHANVSKCTFDGNEAFYGGGIGVLGQLLRIYSCKFFQNKAIKSAVSSGGAVDAQLYGSKVLVVLDSEFHGNKASYSAGAIKTHFTHGYVTIEGCTFEGNSASYGGAFASSSANTIRNSNFVGNFANLGGGALQVMGQIKISVSFSNFTNNSACNGGAIFARNTFSFFCKKCSFHGNTAVAR